MSEDKRYMTEALELARRPLTTLGNPRVGAVLVHEGAIIGEGWHEGSGTPHAEAMALRAPASDGTAPLGATLYVTLEPCTHEGRMPACAPQVIAAGVRRVVVATADPDERVAGSGIRALQEAGIEVTVGVLEDEARSLNAPYLHHRTTGSAFLTLKLALSLDGRLGAPDGSSRWITGPEARSEVHRRRAEAGAVMVGSGTVLADDPSLSARGVGAVHQPLKVVLDASGRVHPDARLFGDSETLMVTTSRCPHDTTVGWKERGAEVTILETPSGAVDVPALLESLGRRGITHVFCEGGARLATSLLANDLVDRLEIYRGPVILGGGGPEIGDVGLTTMADASKWRTEWFGALGADTLQILVKESSCSQG